MSNTIIPEARVRLALGLTDTISDLERVLVALAHRKAESAIKNHIYYDPIQREVTEFYSAQDGEFLQLRRIPVRSITSVYVDSDGHFGQYPGAFAAGTLWEAGVEYWLETEQANYGGAGQLIAASAAWPNTPGSIKVTYRAGYARREFLGMATSSGVESDGEIYTAGVDAGALAAAVELTAVKAFHTLYAFSKKRGAGFAPGGYTSETLGAYRYTLAGGAASATGMSIAVPAEAADMLEAYINYGALLA